VRIGPRRQTAREGLLGPSGAPKCARNSAVPALLNAPADPSTTLADTEAYHMLEDNLKRKGFVTAGNELGEGDGPDQREARALRQREVSNVIGRLAAGNG